MADLTARSGSTLVHLLASNLAAKIRKDKELIDKASSTKEVARRKNLNNSIIYLAISYFELPEYMILASGMILTIGE